METSLRNRLTYGPIMLAALFGLLFFDHWFQTWSVAWNPYRDRGIAGVGIVALLMFILPIATVELATLFTAERLRPFRFISATGSGLLIIHAFATQFPRFQPIAASTLAFIIVFVMLGAALARASQKVTHDAIVSM